VRRCAVPSYHFADGTDYDIVDVMFRSVSYFIYMAE